MKKTLALGLAALALLACSQQKASAWSKFNFGIGANIGWEGGGNSVLWGVLKGGPTPGMYDHGFGGAPIMNDHGFGGPSPSYGPEILPAPLPGGPKPMPSGAPGVAQPVGYFPYADPAAGYYPPNYYSANYYAPAYYMPAPNYYYYLGYYGR